MSSSIDSAGSLPHQSLLALIWTCFSVATLFVLLRTAIRFRVASRPTVDDCWIFLALAALLTLCILDTVQLPSLYYITAVISGAVSISEKLITETENYLRFQFPIIILFWTTLWCVKASFLGLYYRLFRELALYRRVWYALATFTFLAYVGCVVTLSLSCGRDVGKFFKFAQCASPADVWASNFSVYYSTAVDVFTDLCIMAMPLRLIYNVKISRKQKAGLVCVFGLGFVMIAFAIIRAKQVLVQQNFVNLTLLMIWSTLTATISVIVGSLPALKIFVTNRAAEKRSRNDSTTGNRKRQAMNRRSGSVPLSSFSSDKKSPSRRSPDGGDSEEEILQSEGQKFVMVQHDITVSYDEADRRPPPVYAPRRPPPPESYGRAF